MVPALWRIFSIIKAFIKELETEVLDGVEGELDEGEWNEELSF